MIKRLEIGNFKKNAKFINTLELFNKEILIAGFGRIGKSLIKRCLNFDMKVKVFDPYQNKEIIEQHGGIKIDNFNEGLRSCDILSLHMPLNEKTKNLMNYKTISLMKKNSILINTARGGIVNEFDLDKALKDNIIFGAGLDVFQNEPILNDNPLLKNDKVILSPHSATYK